MLDEPNSNLDAEGDEALTRAIRGVRTRGGIVVVVAHRPSVLAGVDMLLVLKRGPRAGVRSEGDRAGQVLRQRSAPPRRLKIVSEREACQIMSAARHGAQSLDPAASAHRPGIVIVLLAGGVGGWAATAQISGAVIAPGQVVVDTNVKKVQHPTGGVVGECVCATATRQGRRRRVAARRHRNARPTSPS